MKTNERKFQVNVHYEVSENGIITDGLNGTTTATAQEAAQWIINFAEENSNYTITEFSIRDCETYKKYRSEDADIQALNSKSEAATEETTKASTDNNVGTAIDKLIITATERPDGTPTAYYVNGVKTRKHKIEFYYANNPAYDGLIEIDHYVARYYLPEIYNNKSRVIFKNWGGTGKTIVTKAAAEELGLRIGRKVAINPTLYLVEENTEEIIEVDPAEYAITPEAMDVATNAEIENANKANANKTAKTQIKEKSPMIIAISREAEKMTISAGTGKAKVKKYFVDGEKMTRGQTEIVIRSYVQSAIETGATIEIDSRLANEFDAIAKTPYKGEFTLIHVDENGKPVKVDDEKQGMFADSVDATPYHAKIIMFGDKVPMFQVICNGRELNSKRGGRSFSQKEVDEWIIKTYQQRKQYPNLIIEVPEVVATLYLDSFACNPRFIRELNVMLTKLEEKAADVDPSEYATTPEAMGIAINAEIELANAANVKAIKEQIAHIKSDIHYREGALKDLEENHLAKYPDDESLKELRAEWVNELSTLKAQLANLENGEAKAVAEAKEAAKERDTEFEKAMTEIRFFAHCMDVKSLKNQIADVENEINSLVRMINRAGKTYGTPAYDLDDNKEFINNLGADLADKLNKLANLKAALAKMAPYEIGESDADNSVEIYNVGRAGVLNRSHKKTNKMITGFLDANIEYEKEARRKTG